MANKRIVITGGGTGGHVFPALAIADEMRARGYEVVYVGTTHGMEAKLVPERGFRFVTVKTGAVKNQSVLKIVKTFWFLAGGILKMLSFLRREKPVAVIGVGGYVSFPACFAGWLLGIPVFLQEQNASVGIANRVLGKFSREIFLGFPQAKAYFPERKCVHTGNPLRKDLYLANFPSHDPESNQILVMGGSQGARAINKVMIELLEEIQTKFPGVSILHQTGKSECEMVREEYRKKFRGKFEVVPFIENMPEAYAKAALVVARSGALTVSELIQVARPAIFVPYPRTGQNDQVDNAKFLEAKGAARMVEQGERFRERFWEVFRDTYLPSRLGQMAASYGGLRVAGAAGTIGDRVEAGARNV